ncbi:MAG: Holliday junction branch migration protein RuvA [Rhodothermales bacterium]|nr:Holliday junction branch migration protein RuvA [Rhodothermales bacterium]
MITTLKGTLVEKKPTEIVVAVGGVGFQLLITTSTFETLPDVASPISLYTHLHVREESLTLFAFSSEDERSVFRILISVSGVGPKLALAALSSMSPNELRGHVVSRNLGILTKIPGVGKKTAERLVVELRDKLEPVELSQSGDTTRGSSTVRMDAVSALQALGLSRSVAEKNVDKVLSRSDGSLSIEQVIRHALRD